MAERGQNPNPKRKRIFSSNRYRILLWCAMLAIIVGSTATFAWYGFNKREADSASADVMKPYYLTLLNPSETDGLQLAVGNLFPGNVKQVVFCVSNRDNENTAGLEMGGTSFEYSIELIHTENLALEYEIYELTEVSADTAGAIAALDEVKDESGNTISKTTYWKKKSVTPLSGSDVSSVRHTAVGLTGTMPVNAGKYIAYQTASDNTAKLQLSAGGDEAGNPTFDSQFFLLEIKWQDGAEFEKYKKETDMIYLLVEALQPQPQKKTP